MHPGGDSRGSGRAGALGRQVDRHATDADARVDRDRGSERRCGMIPAEFDYEAPESLEDTFGMLQSGGEEATLLAGGHSLLPLMKLRLAAPALLVELRRVPGLQGIQREDGTWRIGAMVPHAELEHAPELGLLSRAAGTIADPQVRNRGTIGGSLAHGDPASDLPGVLLAAEGSVTVQGQGGQRTLEASELFRDYLQTALEPA